MKWNYQPYKAWINRFFPRSIYTCPIVQSQMWLAPLVYRYIINCIWMLETYIYRFIILVKAYNFSMYNIMLQYSYRVYKSFPIIIIPSYLLEYTQCIGTVYHIPIFTILITIYNSIRLILFNIHRIPHIRQSRCRETHIWTRLNFIITSYERIKRIPYDSED